MTYILVNPDQYPTYFEGLCKNEVDILGTDRRRLDLEPLQRSKISLERRCQRARTGLLKDTRSLHDEHFRWYLVVEKLVDEKEELEKLIPRRERQLLSCREQRERLRDLDKEITRLKAECNQQLDNTRSNISKHRSGLLHFREKHEQISEQIESHKALQNTRHWQSLAQQDATKMAMAREFSTKLSLQRKPSILDELPGLESPTNRLMLETNLLANSALKGSADWRLMLDDLRLEGAYHLQDMLFDMGVCTRGHLAKMSIEHVRSLSCSNSDKTALINATRTARQRIAGATSGAGAGGTDGVVGGEDASVALLTSRRGEGFLPLFGHRIDKLGEIATRERNVADDLRKAVNERNLDLVRSILATQAGRDAVNVPGSDGWTVLQRACVHKQDAALRPNSTFGRKRLPTRSAFQPAPWVQTFGRASLEATQHIKAAEGARKSTAATQAESDSGDPRVATSASALSVFSEHKWVDEDVPSPCKLQLHAVKVGFSYGTNESNLERRELGLQQHNTEIVKNLLLARADVNLTNVYGRTALHYAAMEGNVSACRALVDAGALPDQLDHHGFTAVQHAVLMKRADWDHCHDFLTEVMVKKPSEEEMLARTQKSKRKGKKGGKGKKKSPRPTTTTTERSRIDTSMS